jgi:hypothetical protein
VASRGKAAWPGPVIAAEILVQSLPTPDSHAQAPLAAIIIHVCQLRTFFSFFFSKYNISAHKERISKSKKSIVVFKESNTFIFVNIYCDVCSPPSPLCKWLLYSGQYTGTEMGDERK